MSTNIIIIIAILIIPAIAQILLSANYRHYRSMINGAKISGFEVARAILDKNGLNNIHIVQTAGNLSDHYDSTRQVVRLSKDVFDGNTIAALAVAAHECGHAIQDKNGYFFMRIRSFIFPVVKAATSFSYILFFIALVIEAVDLMYVAIALVAMGLIFQLITLPVEFNASKIAKKQLQDLSLVKAEEVDGATKMLFAAALTYVAGVLASALNIVRLILIANDRRR